MGHSKPIQLIRSDFSHSAASLAERRPRVETEIHARSLRVLVVEDDRDVRDALSSMIADCGCDVLLAEDGVRGLARAERDAPDLVLLDLMLPQRSGITVLDQLKLRRIHRIPVVVMSGSPDPRHRHLALEHGADGFLPKPFHELQFLELVHSLLSPAPRITA